MVPPIAYQRPGRVTPVRGITPDDFRGPVPSYFLPPDSYRRGTGTGVDQGNGVVEMTAVVSRERARTTGLTAAAGVLMLAVAFVMMVVAAPGHRTAPVHDPAKTATEQLTASRCDQLTSRSNSATVRACRAGPPAESAWADAY